jgi:hypothetical protein
MTRRPKQPLLAETPTPDADAILQIKVWLLDSVVHGSEGGMHATPPIHVWGQTMRT